jgi:hypothetical protein
MSRLRKLSELTGYRLQASDGEIGKLEEIFFDDLRWSTRYFVVRTGNWLFGRRVLIVTSMIREVDEAAKSLSVDLTCEQIRQAPEVDTELPVSRHYEREFYRYYAWEPYWTADPMFGPDPFPYQELETPGAPENPHLRSSNKVTGYSLHADDGEIGHVADLIVEEPGWPIRYLEIDTRSWLPGKHVLVAPAWIREVDWALSEVKVNLHRDTIRSAPAYDTTKPIGHDYEVALFRHYGRKLPQD